MKKLLITAFALLAFAAGSQAQTNNKNAKNMKTIALTKADFLKKVADYEKNPEEWKLLHITLIRILQMTLLNILIQIPLWICI